MLKISYEIQKYLKCIGARSDTVQCFFTLLEIVRFNFQVNAGNVRFLGSKNENLLARP